MGKISSIIMVLSILAVSSFSMPPSGISKGSPIGVSRSVDTESYIDINNLLVLISNIGQIGLWRHYSDCHSHLLFIRVCSRSNR